MVENAREGIKVEFQLSVNKTTTQWHFNNFSNGGEYLPGLEISSSPPLHELELASVKSLYIML